MQLFFVDHYCQQHFS
ncbi:hypothetical protein OIU79_008312 [Salix purpurea]|uniref:Uncharacterized protein n=1 Tax=Salix purpurea TaxID=77065 RepID=A0A9Q0TI51_SALPP|nr:hypothetical protein OIU79_008312 [Salix purpurea]